MTGKRIFLALGLLLAPFVTYSKTETPTKLIPVDPELRTGRLPNGLTYYVRHNGEPAGQVCFHLVQDAGSVLEEDNERGFAHFMEHMSFNGTVHFPGNSLISWLQKQGVKVGNDLNARTKIDETIYSIDNVPSGRKNVLDSCLLIIHDWCTGVTFDDEEVEKERGVIMEELRTHHGMTTRLYEQLDSQVYPDSCRYSNRLPGGSMEVVRNLTPGQLKAYWRKWSRPDLQAIVVVGDIDADEMVRDIRERFSDIPAPGPDAPERIRPAVPSNGDVPVIAYARDKEQTVPTYYLYKKQAVTPFESRTDEDYYWMLFIRQMMDLMIANRLSDMLAEGGCPWADVSIGETEFFISKTKDSWMGVMASYPDKTEEGIAKLYREMLRIERHGFTQAEYDSAIKEYLSALKKADDESSLRSSRSYCSMFDRNFIDNEPMPSARQKLELVREISKQVDLPFINFYCQLMPKADMTVIGLLPEGFSEPDVKAILAGVEAETIEAYEDKEPPSPLMTYVPERSASVKVGGAALGYEKYILANGATVYVKDTDFNQNQIQIRCFSDGGTSMYGDEDLVAIDDIDNVFMLGGLGELSRSGLSRSLSGKQVSFTPEIGTYDEGLYGSSTPEDFETMLQLAYLTFTGLRSDSTAFETYLAKRTAAKEGEDRNDQTALNDTINRLVYCNHPRARRLTADEVRSMDYDRVMEIARERFSDASDFTFIFTGHFDEGTMMPLIERYIGSLPSTGKLKEHHVNRGVSIVRGRRSCSFTREMETPAAASVRIFSRKAGYTLRENMVHELLGQCLTIRLERDIREKEGATYSISAKAKFNVNPVPKKSLQIFYQTDPERVDEIDAKIDGILKDFAQHGPDRETLDQVVEYKMKRYGENTRSNAWYSTILMEILQTGVDFCSEYEDVVKSISVKDIARELRRLLRSGNEVKVTMTGVKE